VFCLCVLATLALESGHPDEGRRALASIEGAGREGFLASEIIRLEGELHLQSGSPDIGAAEQCFVAAIDLARRRQEKSLELRAATSLARLRRQQNRDDEARRAVADVYGWFTEGFDTADLTAAKTLLEAVHRVE
jgi:predicted ATPase